MVFILMGVSGSGKTTVGRLLAERLSLPFHDADDYHSIQSIEKMKGGTPLHDEDRIPWLQTLSSHIRKWNRERGAVLACSALKESYRRVLSNEGAEEVIFIHLSGDKFLIHGRLTERKGHYFSLALLQSQFETLETPADAIMVNIDKSPEEICACVLNALENK